jgi:hypothetical protein
VILTAAERDQLKRVLAEGAASARKLTHARILLKADQGPDGPGWVDQVIAEAVEVSEPTISRLRKPSVEQGLEAALNRRPPTRTYVRKLDGVQEAKLIALACAQPPAGQARWSLRLLADKLVEREIVEHAVSYQTVRRMLQKTRSSRTRGSSALVHPARGQRRVRLAQGRRPRRLYSPPLPVPLAGLPGRDRETVAPRHAGGAGARTGPSSTRGRCVRARGRRLAGAPQPLRLRRRLAFTTADARITLKRLHPSLQE